MLVTASRVRRSETVFHWISAQSRLPSEPLSDHPH